MIVIATIEGQPGLLALLASSAVRALALAACAGLALAAFRVKAASLRLFTWTSVLYAALAMPLLGWILPALPIPTPSFLRDGVARIVASIVQLSQPTAPGPIQLVMADAHTTHVGVGKKTSSSERLKTNSASSVISSTPASTSPSIVAAPVSPSSSRPTPLSVRWSIVATAIYLAVALVLLGRFVVGLILGSRLLRSSVKIHEPRITARLASRAHNCGLAFFPQAAESAFISVPITMGALRSTILLPSDWREWDHAKLDAVVAHEVSHVARRDALTQRLSLLHRAIFWFSPLAWWLDRQLADLAEQASDEAALCCGADCNDYARTLLGFFEALQTAPGRVWWQGVSMAKAGQAEKRLERILAWRGTITMSLKKPIAVAIIALAIPVVYLAASARPSDHNQSSPNPTLAQDQTPPPAQRATPAPKAESGTTPEPALAPTSEVTPPPQPAAQATTVPAPAAISGDIARVPPPAYAPVAPIPAITGAPAAIAPMYPPRSAVVPRTPLPPAAIWSAQS